MPKPKPDFDRPTARRRAEISVYSLDDLYECVWEAVENRLDFVKRPEAARFEGSVAAACAQERQSDFPALRHLRSAITIAEQGVLGPVASILRETHDALSWSQNPGYSEASLGHRFMNNYTFGALTGEDVEANGDLPTSGFMLIGPDTEYRAHRHAPREIYLLLTPGTDWQLDRSEWFPVDAGCAVFHDAWQFHAMRTGDSPMLAFAAWLDPGDRRQIRIGHQAADE